MLALADKHVFPEGKIPVHIVFHPPDNRHRDHDNLLAQIKAGLDGIAEAWGINDKRFGPVTVDIGEKAPHGRVMIKFN